MKILQVCPRYYKSVGGVEHTVQKLSEGLKDKGHEVAVICGGSSSKLAKSVDDNGIRVFQFRLLRLIILFIFRETEK